ncbi:MAG: ATP-binding protein [Stackebrandtia sp.]
MIVWLNGTFGAGKTSTSRELVDLIPSARIFDTEQVGYMLDHVLDRVGDFQHHLPWRDLVVDTATRLLDHLGVPLVVPQSVLVEQYWKEVHDGLTAAGVVVHHYVLHADRATLVNRIESDTAEESSAARQWRLDHLDVYEQALPWLEREAAVIDTTALTPTAVATEIARRSA